jgi:hypothetical protein
MIGYDEILFPISHKFPKDKYKEAKTIEELLKRMPDLNEAQAFIPLEKEKKEMIWRKNRVYLNSIPRNKFKSLPRNFSQMSVENFLESHYIYDKSHSLFHNPHFLPFLSVVDRQRLICDVFDQVETLYPSPNFIRWNDHFFPHFISQVFPSTFTDPNDDLSVEDDFVVSDPSQVNEILELRNIVEEEMSFDPSLKTAVTYHLNNYLQNRKYPDTSHPRYVTSSNYNKIYLFRKLQVDPRNEKIERPTDFFP